MQKPLQVGRCLARTPESNCTPSILRKSLTYYDYQICGFSFVGSRRGMKNMVSSVENIKIASFSRCISKLKGVIEREKQT